MGKANTWLYDADGNVRKELYLLSKQELDEKQLEVTTQQDKFNPPYTNEPTCQPCDAKTAALWPETNPALKALQKGDIIYIKPEYAVARAFGGRMTFIAFAGVAGGAPPSKGMFCRTEDGGGGFIGADMLVDPLNPRGQP